MVKLWLSYIMVASEAVDVEVNIRQVVRDAVYYINCCFEAFMGTFVGLDDFLIYSLCTKQIVIFIFRINVVITS